MTRALARTFGLTLALALAPATAQAQARFEELGTHLGDRVDRLIHWHGAFRTRSNLFWNLDLDRGPTPSGAPLFPVPLADPTSQLLTHVDMRLRTDLSFVAPNGGLAVHLRLDLFDDLALGSAPDGPPSAATGQTPSSATLLIKRAWAETLTPFGVLAAGRMGSHWGLGLLTHGGDDPDSDSGDAADRIAFVAPLFGLVLALAWDFTAIGPTTARGPGQATLDLDPSDDVSTVTVALLRYHDAPAHRRRLRADKATLDLGAYVSHRWQRNDIPAAYTPASSPPALDPAQVMARGFSATAVDGWLRLTHPAMTLEAEAAFLTGGYDQASLVPGVLLRPRVTATQWGFALQSRFGDITPPPLHPRTPLAQRPPADEDPSSPLSTAGPRFTFGLDLGAASGDPAFGFGVSQPLISSAPQRGDLDGSQLRLPYDAAISNFRFHSDFRVDQILFRRIIGTVTDAFYLRPHARLVLPRFLSGALTFDLALVASWALEPTSTPGQAGPLGLELDPSLSYVSDDGFRVDLDYAVLIPLAGLSNPELGLEARPAQLWRLRLGYHF